MQETRFIYRCTVAGERPGSRVLLCELRYLPYESDIHTLSPLACKCKARGFLLTVLFSVTLMMLEVILKLFGRTMWYCQCKIAETVLLMIIGV